MPVTEATKRQQRANKPPRNLHSLFFVLIYHTYRVSHIYVNNQEVIFTHKKKKHKRLLLYFTTYFLVLFGCDLACAKESQW